MLEIPPVEIVRDTKEHAVEDGLTLGEDHEILGTFHWLEWLKRSTGNHRLFVYRHRFTGNFALCVWAFDPEETTSPVAIELQIFKENPGTLWPKDLLHPYALLQRLRPVEEQVKERYDARIRKMKEEQSRNEADAEHKQHVIQYLRRKGLDQAAHLLDIGATPFVGPARAQPGRLEEWSEMAKSAIRSS